MYENCGTLCPKKHLKSNEQIFCFSREKKLIFLVILLFFDLFFNKFEEEEKFTTNWLNDDDGILASFQLQLTHLSERRPLVRRHWSLVEWMALELLACLAM